MGFMHIQNVHYYYDKRLVLYLAHVFDWDWACAIPTFTFPQFKKTLKGPGGRITMGPCPTLLEKKKKGSHNSFSVDFSKIQFWHYHYYAYDYESCKNVPLSADILVLS